MRKLPAGVKVTLAFPHDAQRRIFPLHEFAHCLSDQIRTRPLHLGRDLVNLLEDVPVDARVHHGVMCCGWHNDIVPPTDSRTRRDVQGLACAYAFPYAFDMNNLNASDARDKLDRLLDETAQAHEPVLITDPEVERGAGR